MTLEYVSDLELEKKFKSDHPVVVLYSLERDADLKMSRILGRIAADRSSDAVFCRVRLSDAPERAQRHSITAGPLVRMFIRGRPVAQLAGLQTKDTIIKKIDSIMNMPIEELKPLNQEELKVHVAKGEWTNAFTSGLLAGVAFGFAMHKLDGAVALFVPAAAIGFFILNENFHFSWPQKAFAIALMLAVGFFGSDILRWAIAN